MNITKKIIFGFIAFLIAISSVLTLPTQALAQDSTWYNQTFDEWFVKVYDTNNPSEIYGERYTAAQVQWIVYSLISLPIMAQDELTREAVMCVLGGEITNCIGAVKEALSKVTDVVFPDISAYTNSSPLALVFDTDNRDLSGISYVKNTINNFSFISEANAQGYGFGAVSWVQKYWSGFRNMAYALTVMVVIVFAFMVMFRVKISPQVVISVQSSLPKIFIALILATFSFAIAGFMIDLMYVVSGLFASLLNMAGFSSNFGGAYALISGTGWAFRAIGVFTIFFMMIGYMIVFLLAAFASFVATILSGPITGALISLIMMLAVVVLIGVTIWYSVKIPYILIKTLVSIYVSIITAPLQIVAGALIPSIGFGPWLKKLAGDLLVFPVVGLLFWFAWATLWSSFRGSWQVVIEGLVPQSWGLQTFPGDTWVPPILSSGADMTGLIFLFISFTIIISIPKIATNIKLAFMGEKLTWGTGIGEAVGPFTGLGRYAAGAAQEGIGRYAGAPLIKSLMDTKRYQDMSAGGRKGEQFNKFVQALYNQLNNRRR